MMQWEAETASVEACEAVGSQSDGTAPSAAVRQWGSRKLV